MDARSEKLKGSFPIGRAKSSLIGRKLIKIGVNQDISWSSDREKRKVGWDILDGWVVMPIYSTKEVGSEFL
ncbi:hypothetical protein TNCV_5136301 [Trichonephila clavipes]|nr:hypothetical protein TNCV_5136301 [Trichonephila clavipes]